MGARATHPSASTPPATTDHALRAGAPEQRPSQPSSALGSSSGELPKSTDPDTSTLTGAALAASAPSSQPRCPRPSTSQRLLSSSVWAATEASRGASLALGDGRPGQQTTTRSGVGTEVDGMGSSSKEEQRWKPRVAAPPAQLGHAGRDGWCTHTITILSLQAMQSLPARPGTPPAVGLHVEGLGAKGGGGGVAGHLPQRVLLVGRLPGRGCRQGSKRVETEGG